MMNEHQQPDNLFRDKLQNYQRPAPQSAWTKIESSLEKKTDHKFLWWKVAALFLLIATSSYIVWKYNWNSSERPLAHVEEPLEALPQKVEEKMPDTPAEVQNSSEGHAIIPKAILPRQSSERKRNSIDKSAQAPASKTNEVLTTNEGEPSQQLNSPEPVTPTVEPAQSTNAKSTITLTFSSAETNQYLNKNALAEATSNEKKSSTLKKFLKKANDLKSNQDPFGDLRERKNEIFALNFKTDKRGQNK